MQLGGDIHAEEFDQARKMVLLQQAYRLIPLGKLKKSSAIKEESDNLAIEEINKILLTNNYNFFDIISCNLIDI